MVNLNLNRFLTHKFGGRT